MTQSNGFPSAIAPLREARLAEIYRLIGQLNEGLKQAADMDLYMMIHIETVEHTADLTRPVVTLCLAEVHERDEAHEVLFHKDSGSCAAYSPQGSNSLPSECGPNPGTR